MKRRNLQKMVSIESTTGAAVTLLGAALILKNLKQNRIFKCVSTT